MFLYSWIIDSLKLQFYKGNQGIQRSLRLLIPPLQGKSQRRKRS